MKKNNLRKKINFTWEIGELIISENYSLKSNKLNSNKKYIYLYIMINYKGVCSLLVFILVILFFAVLKKVYLKNMGEIESFAVTENGIQEISKTDNSITISDHGFTGGEVFTYNGATGEQSVPISELTNGTQYKVNIVFDINKFTINGIDFNNFKGDITKNINWTWIINKLGLKLFSEFMLEIDLLNNLIFRLVFQPLLS